jgi:hypothetical protein
MKLFGRLTRNGLTVVGVLLLVLLAELSSAVDGPCIATQLSPGQQQQLDKYLIIKGRTGLLLSPKLIPACDTRQILSQWLTHHLGTPVKPTAEEISEDNFASQHRAILNKVVLRVWPWIAASPAVPEDGALSSEKWGILEDPMIYDSVVDTLLSEDIKREGLSRDGAFLLFSRPLPHASQLLEPILTKPHALLDERLYAFAVLTREKPMIQIPTIDSLTKGFTLNDGQKRTVELLKSKTSAGQAIEWSDLDGLLGDDA